MSKIFLSEDDKNEVIQLCELLINEGILWESNLAGLDSPNAPVYTMDDSHVYVAYMPLTEEVAFILEKLRLILSGRVANGRHN